jgi:tight adherence protein C
MSISTYQNALTIVISMVFLFISLVLVAVAIRSAISHHSNIERRLAGGTLQDSGVVSEKKQGILSKLGHHLTLPSPENISRIRFQLSQAGFFSPTAVQIYHAARVVCFFVPQFIFLVCLPKLALITDVKMILMLFVAIIILSLYAPMLYIRKRTANRREECRNGFPDMMDLLIACVEAGLGMNAALARVGHEIGRRYPTLRVNLDIMNLELRAGQDMNTAMLNFSTRVDLEEARSLAIMLKQAEEMGAGVGRTLRTFADEMRIKRMMKAEEKAMALSAKLTVPLILFIFPTILCMILLPVGIRIMEGMG